MYFLSYAWCFSLPLPSFRQYLWTLVSWVSFSRVDLSRGTQSWRW